MKGKPETQTAREDHELRQRALEIHRTAIVMNAACMSSQALIKPGRDIGKRWQGLTPGTGDLDLPRLRDGAVNVIWQAICGSTGEDETKIPLQGLELADTIFTDILDRYPEQFELALTVIAALVAVTSGGIILATLRSAMDEKRREIAILRSLGARRATVTASILAHAGLITLIGIIGAFALFAGQLHQAKLRPIGGIADKFGIDGDESAFRELAAEFGQRRGRTDNAHGRCLYTIQPPSSPDVSKTAGPP